MKGKRMLAFCLFILMLAVLLAACSRSGGVPDGVYSCIEADTGEMYTFTGKHVRVTLFIMGNITEDHSGTYRVKDGTITMKFPTDADGIYAGSYSYSISEDGSTITIGDMIYTKEKTAG